MAELMENERFHDLAPMAIAAQDGSGVTWMRLSFKNVWPRLFPPVICTR